MSYPEFPLPQYLGLIRSFYQSMQCSDPKVNGDQELTSDMSGIELKVTFIIFIKIS